MVPLSSMTTFVVFLTELYVMGRWNHGEMVLDMVLRVLYILVRMLILFEGLSKNLLVVELMGQPEKVFHLEAASLNLSGFSWLAQLKWQSQIIVFDGCKTESWMDISLHAKLCIFIHNYT
ncbi:hypothetical protein V6N13_144511 [Hibiscus sabdariffa]|uniref:Uncharacterized protein n=1 Tax=Hibiscus sabdariffa TaxID=183260 RepID=A0ABR2FKK6_9ROSI